ncbi:uncharacterized protein I303_104129 [Kwoniella dejecticola CBS 10117]|uniref:FAD dependent oxidoreductase domain-containing protein n=1 Tax=Kwoniella dejecticola CBS 10117 TaxID=1296121 RepID=A0A1A6A669_9TREE|nr:uncharacterized protein I303_04892 [Kwoniella dejecticola CBS 10117]OBR85556.1 hypothetical protein I303_04892 [Kwoniella dejecticola CBS 10117]
MTSTERSIAIVGAGVFGLSTALHLSKRGYKDVTVFDYQPYHKNAYNPSDGCDSASADVNKVYRCSYGNETEYQDLAFSGREIWLDWNRQIADSAPEDLPHGLTPNDKLLVANGFLRIAGRGQLSEFDQQSLDALEKAGLRHHQHVLLDKADLQRLWEKEAEDPSTHWKEKINALEKAGGGGLNGFIDTSAGFTYADKACTWARHLAEKAGVKFVLGPEVGKFEELLSEDGETGKKVTGLRTADGKEHAADVVIVAGGGWTPSIIPEVENLLETTAGSVVTITLPKDRQDLWDKFSPEKFPVWAYGLMGKSSPEFGGFYGFPRTPEGQIKIGYRGRKWTNFQTHPKTGKRLSVPRTKYTTDKAVNLPKKAIDHIKTVIAEIFPELKEIGITDTRMCWYTDSIDNSFVIDYVPGYNDGLFVASGGSGHGFKFLPVLGEHVVNALERKPEQFTKMWEWRSSKPGEPANGIEEGEKSGRNLAQLDIADEQDWLWIPKNTIHVGANGDERVVEKLDGVEKLSAATQKLTVNA